MAAGYAPEVFPIMIPKGWKGQLRAVRSSGASCNNDILTRFYTQNGVSYPIERPILSDMWDAPRGNPPVPHRALDIFGATGSPVVADSDGTVLSTWKYEGETLPGVGNSPKGGNYVWFRGARDGYTRYYAHLMEFPLVKPGQVIRAGQLLGYLGDTGNAKGSCPHLHIAVTDPRGNKVDPYPALLEVFNRLGYVGTPIGWSSNRWLWWLLAAGVVGGGAYWLGRR